MPQTISTDRDTAWSLLLTAARSAERAASARRTLLFAQTPDADLCAVPPGHPDAVLAWRPGAGWEALIPTTDARRAFIDLYLPLCSATTERPITIGHLGQSLDGFIATHAGESRWVTGQQNILHLHRLRALCDAVIVGAGTVAADDPQLTTRLVPGSNPLRIVLDPGRRLSSRHRVFTDAAAETLYVCARSLVRPGERHMGAALIVGLSDAPQGVDVGELVRLLWARGCTRIFVEGGGVTVSMFLEANLLDRLHVAVAPLIIGDGRPAIRLPPRPALGDCHRPRYRVFRMGRDVLFDCENRVARRGRPGRAGRGSHHLAHSAALGEPRNHVVVPDDDARLAGHDVSQTPGQPAANHRRLVRGDFHARLRPAFDQFTLQRARGRRQPPVARRTLHAIPSRGQGPLHASWRVRSGRTAESLVVLPLVAVHQVADGIVFGFRRLAAGVAVVGEREAHRRPRRPAPFGEQAHPWFGHQVEQRRRRHQVPPGEQLRRRLREILTAGFNHGSSHTRRHVGQQGTVAIDGEPLLRRGQERAR